MYKQQKAFIFAMLVFVSTCLLPAVASAQYGGGGIISGPFSIGFVATPPPSGNSGGSGTGSVLGAAAYNFTVNLHYGDTGAAVTALQTILIADGYLKISTPTGWFGPLTFAAVKEYQTANGIPDTGFVGALTRASLNKGTVSLNTTKKDQGVVSDVVGAVANLWNAWQATKAQ
jgi:peptidoglycan hydrolase-like protein with peptidoglycan-binding domain